MTRIELALLACKGMTDQDLAQRGEHGFPKMIIRKRMYADAARNLAKKCEALTSELEAAQQTIAMLEELNKPVDDVSQVDGLLKSLFGSK